MTGATLDFLPSSLVSWNEFITAYPDGRVLSRDTGAPQNYDHPRYIGFDDTEHSPLRTQHSPDPRLKPVERVVGLTIDGRSVAYPFALLERHQVVNDSVSGVDIVVFYTREALSAFATRSPIGGGLFGVGEPRTVGSAAVYKPSVDGKSYTFTVRDEVIVDRETGSQWNILGQAVEGTMRGSQLTPVVHSNPFWFAWVAFNPDTAVHTAEDVRGKGS